MFEDGVVVLNRRHGPHLERYVRGGVVCRGGGEVLEHEHTDTRQI